LLAVCATVDLSPAEVFIRIQAARRYLWHAVDQDGVVLDILVQERRDGNAAKRFACCPTSNIDKAATSTIALRTHIDRHDAAIRHAVASSDELAELAECWREWAEDAGAFFAFPWCRVLAWP
jgi:transposase-like protein